MTARPQLWVIAGPNGAGKSTFVQRHRLADRIPVINPDEIARSIGHRYEDEPTIMLRAGREAARLRRWHIAEGRSFAIETTLSGHSELRAMTDARSAGFKVNLIFLGIAGPETSMARVRSRVLGGGHDVPVIDIRRRYARAMANLPIAMAIVHRGYILDNQGRGRPRLLIVMEDGDMRLVARPLPVWARIGAI